MMKHFLLAAFFILVCASSKAGTSRALIIGINQYKAPPDSATNSPRSLWRNLSGCVNDAESIRDLIITKYGFAQPDITTLFNTEASRDRIIAELKKLIAISVKGDVVFIFYAGHGSQMTNSLSKESDKKDETIVPADSWKGAADIRDKELAGYFNALIDKGVLLTVIFDSCHSGSVGRGLLYEVDGLRYMEPNPLDAKDPSDPPRPEDRGALIISAAQDDEFAKELKDENNVIHGAFTLAVLKSIQQYSVDAPVQDIFNSALAVMKFFGKTQQPVLAGNQQRKNQNLFGLPKGALKNRFAIPVAKSDATGLELMGGYALGLSTGVKLKSLNGNDTIQVNEMIGANRSRAKLISKSGKTIAAGTPFEVITWTTSAAPALKIYIPSAEIQLNELQPAIKTIQSAKIDKATFFVTDVTRSKPARVISYTGGKWLMFDAKEGKKELGAKFSVRDIQHGFVNLPPVQGLNEAFRSSFGSFSNVQVVSDPGESMYTLVGTVNNKNELVYAFVKTNITVEDTMGSLPSRTDYIAYDPAKLSALTDSLAESVFRIAKIRDWLLLQPPVGENKFPFNLQIEYYKTGKPVGKAVKLGDTLSLYLKKKNPTDVWNRKKRFIYVFSIDSKGSMQLLFPNLASGNTENRFPLAEGMERPADKTLLFHVLVTPPTGTDNYFMLTTEEQIGNLSAFQQPGVISRGPKTANPLEAILFTGTKSRDQVTVPVTWSIDKVVLTSQEKTAR